MTRKKLVLHGLWALAVSGALILGTATSSLANGELEVLASGDASDDSYGDLTIDVNRLKQAEDGKYTSLTLTINNNSDKTYSHAEANFDGYGFEESSMSGFRLYDESSETYHYPLQDTRESTLQDGRNSCLCPAPNTEEFLRFVEPDSSGTYWASYILPEDLETASVHVPGFEPVEVDIE